MRMLYHNDNIALLYVEGMYPFRDRLDIRAKQLVGTDTKENGNEGHENDTQERRIGAKKRK